MKLAENGSFSQYHLGVRTRDLCLERAGVCSHFLPVSSVSSILSIRTSRTTLSTDRLISHRQQRSKTLGSGAPRLRGALLRTRGVARRRARHPLARLLRLVLLARPLLGERVLGQHSAAGLPLGHSLHTSKTFTRFFGVGLLLCRSALGVGECSSPAAPDRKELGVCMSIFFRVRNFWFQCRAVDSSGSAPGY